MSEKSNETTTKETLKCVHIAISNAKRNFAGKYHKIKRKYLQLYLNEFVYKLNRRYFGERIFDRLVIANITGLWLIADIQIAFLRKNKLNPKPSGNNSNSWIAKCYSEGNHFIQVVTTKDEWGCGYCNKKGTITEMKKWLWEIAMKKDQKNLSKMMQELKNGGIL